MGLRLAVLIRHHALVDANRGNQKTQIMRTRHSDLSHFHRISLSHLISMMIDELQAELRRAISNFRPAYQQNGVQFC